MADGLKVYIVPLLPGGHQEPYHRQEHPWGHRRLGRGGTGKYQRQHSLELHQWHLLPLGYSRNSRHDPYQHHRHFETLNASL